MPAANTNRKSRTKPQSKIGRSLPALSEFIEQRPADLNEKVTNREILAAVISDVHVSHEPPRARSKEKDWYAAMDRYLLEFKNVCHKYNIPGLIAGDLFHTPDEPYQLVNYLRNVLPKRVIAIPGQHDLLHHNYDDLFKTAYGDLVASGRIENAIAEEPIIIRNYLAVYGFPWRQKLSLVQRAKGAKLHVGLLHRYVWTAGCSWGGSTPPKSRHVDRTLRALKNLDLIFSGDNHICFNRGRLYNCGCFIPRISNERQYEPMIHLIRADGEVLFHHVSTTSDVWCDEDDSVEELKPIIEVKKVMKSLKKLTQSGIDFLQVLERAAENATISKRAQQLLDEIVCEVKRGAK